MIPAHTPPSVRLDQVVVRYPMRDVDTSLRPKWLMGGQNGAGGAVARNAKGAKEVHALQDVTLAIENGERVGLIGHNGSGKTTLLRVMEGLIDPAAGRRRVVGRTTALFNIGLGLSVEATGLRNIELRGLMAGLTSAEIQGKVDDIAAFAELGEFIHMPLRTYSQGMVMRLAFAAATAFDAEIILLDEWIGAGDKAFRAKANARLTDLVARSGICVLASHNDAILRDICTRVVWLDHGRVAADGPTEDVLAAYNAR